MKIQTAIEKITVAAYRVPTDFPEADGTIAWDATTMVLVTVRAGGIEGIGYSYTDVSAAKLIDSVLSTRLVGRDAFDIASIWVDLTRAVRNIGRPGVAATAVSAVDNALFDLKAKLLDVPLARMLGEARAGVPVYGSGGFTSYPLARLTDQLSGWVADGITMVKMKVGTHPEDDVERVRRAREAIGPEAKLFVDANGAYSTKQALAMAERFARWDISWFEEPVSSDNLSDLRFLRERGPPGVDIAAGEYGYGPLYFCRMLEARAVDVLQADATRCLGISGFLHVGGLCEGFAVPLSAHTAPSVHVHVCCSLPRVCHLEYFHDHVRIEKLLFDGPASPVKGLLYPDMTRPGLGITLKAADARAYEL